jgi:hypothetical protein
MNAAELPASSDESFARLHRAGWSIGDAAFVLLPGELVWLVSGTNGESVVRARGRTRDEAWREAGRRRRGGYWGRAHDKSRPSGGRASAEFAVLLGELLESAGDPLKMQTLSASVV